MAKPFKVKKGNLVARLSGQERRVLEFVCDEGPSSADPAADPDTPHGPRELGLAGSVSPLDARGSDPGEVVARRLRRSGASRRSSQD